MFIPGSFRLGKIAGIDISVHVSWIIILVLLTVSLAIGWFRDEALGTTLRLKPVETTS